MRRSNSVQLSVCFLLLAIVLGLTLLPTGASFADGTPPDPPILIVPPPSSTSADTTSVDTTFVGVGEDSTDPGYGLWDLIVLLLSTTY